MLVSIVHSLPPRAYLLSLDPPPPFAFLFTDIIPSLAFVRCSSEFLCSIYCTYMFTELSIGS